jgi:hypothetical protein
MKFKIVWSVGGMVLTGERLEPIPLSQTHTTWMTPASN